MMWHKILVFRRAYCVVLGRHDGMEDDRARKPRNSFAQTESKPHSPVSALSDCEGKWMSWLGRDGSPKSQPGFVP